MTRAYEKMEGATLQPFYSALTNEATKENYAGRLRQFLESSKVSPDEFVALARTRPAEAEKLIFEFIGKRKKEGLSSASIATTRDALKLLLTMNRVKKIDWSIINKAIPHVRHHSNDRPPLIEEIRNLMTHADLKIRTVILMAVSSGIRIGALDYLSWGDVEEIKQGNMTLAKLRVYSGEPEEYEAFITPEAYEALLEYRRSRERAGEKIEGKSALIVNDFNKRTGLGKGIKLGRSNSKVIRNSIGRLWKESFERQNSQRQPVKSTDKALRYEFKQVHGFRKFFKSTCEKYMKSLHVELLMGHAVGVTNSYMKPSTKELVEEYVKAIPYLTIFFTVQTKTIDEARVALRRGILADLGVPEQEIEELKLEEMSPQEFQRVAREKVSGFKGRQQEYVPPMEADVWREKGYLFTATLPDGRLVMTNPAFASSNHFGF